MAASNWIETNEALAVLCQRLEAQDWLVLDTEFERRTTFYPKAGLIQLGTVDEVWLIDALAVSDWEPLVELMETTAIVMHSCSEDLEVLRHLCGAIPKRIFDTQVAAALCGLRSGIGFAELAEHLFNVKLDKGETRSNWLQRPLRDSQLRYAEDDVVWLAKAFPALMLRLEERVDWVWEEGDFTIASSHANDHLSYYFDRLTKVADRDPLTQHVAKALSDWREQQARDRDMPRNRVLAEASLVQLAVQKPQHAAAMTDIVDLSPGQIKRYAETWIGLINEVVASEPTEALMPRLLTKSQTKQYKVFMKMVDKEAHALEVPREMLASKKVGQAFIRTNSFQQLPALPKWRIPYLESAQQRFHEKKVESEV
ncbi:MAG: HRDC domain-containing protein [Pseudomonadales bacterium]|jgi:ribonuclease D